MQCKPLVPVLAGVDFASQVSEDGIAFKQEFAHDISFDDNSFEMVTSFDCLEHLYPEEIDEVLEEMARVSSKYLLLKIAYSRSGYKGPNGVELHNTIQNVEWWIPKIAEVTGFAEKKAANPFLLFERAASSIG